MRSLKKLLAVTALLMAGCEQSSAGEAAIKVSCVENGQVVFSGEIPADANATQRRKVADNHPQAMCVFLQPGRVAFGNPVGSGSMPAAPGAGVPDNDLAAALSMIVNGRTGQAYPPEFGELMSGLNVSEGGSVPVPYRPNRVNLAVGIYRNVPLSDIMAHWKTMQDGTEVLSGMTPTVSVGHDISMLSVEGVPDVLANLFCEEAARKGPGCIAFY